MGRTAADHDECQRSLTTPLRPPKIFELYVQGPAGAGPLGITRLAIWLNEHGFKIRGKPFHVSTVQTILRNTAYIGFAFYNKKDSKTGERRPESDWIGIRVPPIVEADQFEAAQTKLVEHRPQNQAARVTTTSNLLIGLARCGCDGDGCSGAMTISTGKSGQYKYYACSNRARSGATVCKGRLLTPERLRDLLSGWLDHSEQASEGRRERLRQLRSRQTSLEGGLERLLDLVVEGQLTASNPQFAKKNAELTEQLAQVKTDIVMLEGQLERSDRRITPELIDRFAALMRDRLRSGEPALRQYYARSIVARVDVGNQEIRLTGSKKALEHAVARTDAQRGDWCPPSNGNGAPGRIRTCDPKLRRLVLYPTELRARAGALLTRIAPRRNRDHKFRL